MNCAADLVICTIVALVAVFARLAVAWCGRTSVTQPAAAVLRMLAGLASFGVGAPPSPTSCSLVTLRSGRAGASLLFGEC